MDEDKISTETQYSVSAIPVHAHTGSDSPRVDALNVNRLPATPSTNALLYWDGNEYISLANGTTGYFLESQGTSSALTWGTSVSPYFGTGADGALTLSSGTHSESLGTTAVYVKNYTSVSLTGTAAVSYSSPAQGGTLIVWRVQGNVTITSSTNPVLDLANLGSKGADSSGIHPGGFQFGAWGFMGTIGPGAAGGTNSGGGGGASLINSGSAGSGASGGAGGTTFTFVPTSVTAPLMIWPCAPGSGGGNGTNGSGTFSTGGRGAGALLILCGGSLTISSAFSAVGGNGGAATGYGGGGGGGGSVVILYNNLVSNSASITATGGTGGSTNGGNGGDGTLIIAQNVAY